MIFFIKNFSVSKIELYLQPQKREFLLKDFGLVVQLVRIPACHAGGRGFESRPDRQQSEVV